MVFVCPRCGSIEFYESGIIRYYTLDFNHYDVDYSDTVLYCYDCDAQISAEDVEALKLPEEVIDRIWDAYNNDRGEGVLRIVIEYLEQKAEEGLDINEIKWLSRVAKECEYDDIKKLVKERFSHIILAHNI